MEKENYKTLYRLAKQTTVVKNPQKQQTKKVHYLINAVVIHIITQIILSNKSTNLKLNK